MLDEYNDILAKTDNENLKEILSIIIKDEQTHANYFDAVLTELKK